jgi:hypothetical protein
VRGKNKKPPVQSTRGNAEINSNRTNQITYTTTCDHEYYSSLHDKTFYTNDTFYLHQLMYRFYH